MLFHSLTFFVFFPTVTALFFASPQRLRWALLLAASYLFYGAWKPQYLLLLLLTTAVDYAVGVWLGREQSPTRRRRLLGASLAANLGVLLTFKYFNFFSASLRVASQRLGSPIDPPLLDVLLPVGVSFYTFQSISYTIDVYRRDLAPEPHFGRFALYVSFFPQLVAGPIERSTALLPQFRQEQRFDADRALSGLRLFFWGLFKKVVIADRAATFVDAIYGHPERFQGLTVVVATYAFAYQIYGDFSGYSDMARGTARVLGFELMRNFDRPYAAASVGEFWRRWHISLSTWFRDYLYVPLGGGRVGAARRAVNLLVVFLVSGLWHGANWTFVVWGALHGAFMVAGLLVERLRGAWLRGAEAPRPLRWVGRALGVVFTFHLVCLGWVFFRADSLDHARRLLERLPVAYPLSIPAELTGIGPAPPEALAVELAILLVSIALVEGGEWLAGAGLFARCPAPVRWLAWASLCVWTLLTAMQSHSPFIYFQF